MFKLYRRIFSILTAILILASCNTQTISIDKVKTTNGFISGTMSADNEVKIFRGIPYAAPPVGNLRWKEPQSLQNWDGIRRCDTFGPNAKQVKPVPFDVYTEEFLIPVNTPISEDCLYLNVWTNAKSPGEKLPVIMFIHGGAFIVGSGSVPIYDGEAMARKGVVFVNINYRLGVFGFFAHPELSNESPHKSSGNYGIMDQIAALQWIKNNIAAFGGDPDNVTIAGQSAGTTSVNVLGVSPLAKNLFHKMIAKSGASVNVLKSRYGRTTILDSAEEKGVQFASRVGATSLNELRQLSADSLLSAFSGTGSAIVDGYVLPEPISAMFAANKQSDLPLMIGYTADEQNEPSSNTVAEYKNYVRAEFGNDTAIILEAYPANNDEQARESSKYIHRDIRFGFQNFAWAAIQSERSHKSYMYFFNRKVPEHGGTNKYGAFHSGEIAYAYDNLKFFNRPFTDADHSLAKLMSSYWLNFAKTGDPNGGDLPVWPAFNRQKGEVMIFDTLSNAAVHPYFSGLNYFYQQALVK